MTIQQLINTRKAFLPHSSTPALDAMLLLAHALGLEREELYARLSSRPDQAAVACYDGFIERRAAGEPVAYITGYKEFYGLRFRVAPQALIPRPDTETLVEWVLGAGHGAEADAGAGELRLHDCCTGTGAIAIALRHERPAWQVSASDISRESGELFRINWRTHIGGRPPWRQQDIFRPVGGAGAGAGAAAGGAVKYHVITANPPYLSDAETAERLSEGWREPALALEGGEDGLEIICRVIQEAGEHLLPGGFLYLEAAESQMEEIFIILKNEGFSDIEYKRDLSGMKRVARGRK